MCGIAGIASFEKKPDKKILQKMEAALSHRGPDGKGYAISDKVGLTMRRLSIIDVKGGDQPLFNEDKSIVIVGNGEIYNYIELQKELIKKGHKLRTGSDIETAIHAYEEWGLNAPKKFRGQFALALHDKNNNKLILIRDRMGEKPIYYTYTKSGLIFASEIKALIKSESADKELDLEAINYFFHFYFIPEPYTPIKNIKKIRSGSMLVVDLNKNTFEEITYWDPARIRPLKDSNPVKSIRGIFSEACTLTMRSDVPVGISLSGGIDSGSILAFCAPQYKTTMNAFSIGYEGHPPSDEREMARKLARKFKVNFIEKEIKVKEVVDNFPNIVWNSDDPIADIAAHSIYEVSKLARKHKVKVLLGGAGGDELFWGYPSTVEAARINLQNLSGINKLLRKDFVYKNPDPTTTGKLISKLYSRNFNSKLKSDSIKKLFKRYALKSEKDILKATFDATRDLWLKSDVIALGDRMSMAASIELRSPFLDYKLTEFVMSSTKCLEGYSLDQKHYLKNAMEGILPREVMERPKRGFTPPVVQWLAGINKKYGHLLKNGFLVKEGILDKNKVSVISTLLKAIPSYSFYQMLIMEIWGREFVWGQSPASLK